MLDDERLSRLVSDIYDAALDAALWPGVLEQTAAFVRGSAASLYAKDVASKTGNVAYQFGMDPRYEQLYLQKYIKLDPTSLGYFIAEIEEPVSTTDVMPYDEFLETRFYKEWVRPQGLVDSAHAMLEKSVTTAAAFVVFRHERDGLVDDEARHRMRLIVPHFRRATLIGKVIDLKKMEAATFADTLDCIGAGTFLVGVNGRVVHANIAGRALLEKGDVLHSASGRLTASDHEADQTLADIFAAAGNGDASIGTKGIALPLLACDGKPYVAHVLPLSSGVRRLGGAPYGAVAAIFVHKAALNRPSPPEAIAKAYKLTPTELRVFLAIVEVGGVPEVAETLGVAGSTVKTHLGRLYEKTGSRRQADLVKLFCGFSNPLLG